MEHMRFRQLCTRMILPALFLWTTLGAATTAPSTGPIIIPTADFPRPDHPDMGVNLENPSDTVRSMMYVDAMKSARG
jgi:hypothetical protein